MIMESYSTHRVNMHLLSCYTRYSEMYVISRDGENGGFRSIFCNILCKMCFVVNVFNN